MSFEKRSISTALVTKAYWKKHLFCRIMQSYVVEVYFQALSEKIPGAAAIE